MSQLCEACEQATIEIVEPCDNANDPYRVCWKCHYRLRARALRPLEWYNLAKRHGWYQYLLHDDFYDDSGVAVQPEEDVEQPDLFPLPSLKSVSQDPSLLLDYSLTRWHFQPDDALAWKSISWDDALPVLIQRFVGTTNTGFRSRILEITASSLGDFGASFVRDAWGNYPESVPLHSLAQASASCLPFREGFDRVVAALARLDGHQKRGQMWSLGFFHSPEALDWIESNIFEPTMESWGYLAAASKIDWARIERWLDHGRPLSLAAIDALAAIVRPQSGTFSNAAIQCGQFVP